MSIAEFFAQGGYAFFVWGAYGMVLVLMVAELLQLRSKRRTIVTRISRMIRLRAQEKSQ